MDQLPDRDHIVQLLDQLGAAEDEKALAAARELDAAIKAASMSWDDLLVPEDDEFENEPEDAQGEDDDDDDDDGIVPEADAGDSAALIDKLLAKSDISDELREELEGYKEDIAEGDFTASDASYLQSLEKRLEKA